MKKTILVLTTLLTVLVSTRLNVIACDTPKVYNRVAIWENGQLLDENGNLWDFKFPTNKACIVMLTVDGKETKINTDDEIIKIKILKNL